MTEPIDPKDEIIASLQEQLRQANECAARWICKYHADENLFNRQNRELAEKDAVINGLRMTLKEIRDYEAYSWNNDRQFIDSRIKKALGEGKKQAESEAGFTPETDPLLRIYQYIEKCGYTYSPQDVLVGYQKNKEGYYVSHTMKDCITNLEAELKTLLGEGDKE